MHRRSHVSYLAISSGCSSVSFVRNLFDSVEELTWFLGGSAKRKKIFLKVASSGRGNQLLNLLTSDAGDLSESAEAIKEGGKKKALPKFAPLVGARVSTLSSLKQVQRGFEGTGEHQRLQHSGSEK